MNIDTYLLLFKPVYQATLFLLLTPLLIVVIRPKDAEKAWLIAAFSFVLFLVVNAVMLWFSNHPWLYFFSSIGLALVYLLVIAIVMPGMLRMMKLKAEGESAMVFLILIYQPIALLLVMLLKWVMDSF